MNALLRLCLPVVPALFCCACSTPEEKADAAFAELTGELALLRGELAGMAHAEQLDRALPQLEKRAETLREILERIDELAIHPDMSAEARRRVADAHREPLRAETDAVLAELMRIGRRRMTCSDAVARLIRRETAHYSTRGVHPWARAVLAGREFRPKKAR